jgi:hypothetical protein
MTRLKLKADLVAPTTVLGLEEYDDPITGEPICRPKQIKLRKRSRLKRLWSDLLNNCLDDYLGNHEEKALKILDLWRADEVRGLTEELNKKLAASNLKAEEKILELMEEIARLKLQITAQ